MRKIHIKNMVCSRCTEAVEGIFKGQGIVIKNIQLGEVIVDEITDIQILSLQVILSGRYTVSIDGRKIGDSIAIPHHKRIQLADFQSGIHTVSINEHGLLKIDADALLGSSSNNSGSATATAGTYTDIVVSGGSGNGAIATVVTSETEVTSVTITTEGSDYAVDDVLTISASDIGRDSGNNLTFTLVADDIDTTNDNRLVTTADALLGLSLIHI